MHAYMILKCILDLIYIYPASVWRTDGACRPRRHVDAERFKRGAPRSLVELCVLRRLTRARTLCARAFVQGPRWQLGDLLVS